MRIRLEQQFTLKKNPFPTYQPNRNRNKTISSRINNDGGNAIRGDGITNDIASTIPNITSTNWCICDSLENRFIGFRQNMQREVGSITKIMTCIVGLNLIQRYSLSTDVVVKVSKNASILNGTSANLKYAKWIKIKDLLYGVMVPSGNDAAYLLAEVFGLLLYYEPLKSQEKDYQDIQSIDISLYENTIPFVNKFIKEMNRQAKQLKMSRTSFANPHGLANSLNFSTAADVLELTKYACSNPIFSKIMSTQQYLSQLLDDDLQTVSEVKQWVNTNKLLSRGWEGVKTGQTLPAGSCLASLKDGIYIILLNSQNGQTRFDQTQTLYNWYSGLSQ